MDASEETVDVAAVDALLDIIRQVDILQEYR